LELLHRIEARSIFVLPGGVAFFVLLGLLPATAAIASIYGLFAEPSELITLTERLNRILPESAMTLVSGVFQRVASAAPGSLGLSAAVALFMTLMSANWGTKAMSEALNVVFDRRETRSYFQYTGVTLLMTTAGAAITGAYAWIMYRLLSDPWNSGVAHYAVTVLEAVSIWALLSFVIGVLYRYAPAPKLDGAPPPIMSGGSMTAALGVLVSSWFLTSQFAGTETFVRNFGPLASVAAVGVWSWTTIVVILLGAEIVEIHEEEKRRRKRTRRWPYIPSWS
jgi:membrane protein